MQLYPQIPRQLEERVNRELEPGESIGWMEMPVPTIFSGGSLGLFIFGIPWTAFSIFWICGAAGFKLPNLSRGFHPFQLFPLFGIPFVLIGLGMLSAPFWAYRKAFKTVYLITDRRAIIIAGGWRTTIRSFLPAQLQEIYRKERRNGTGDVIFSHSAWRDSDGRNQSQEIGFTGVREPMEVERRLRALAGTRA